MSGGSFVSRIASISLSQHAGDNQAKNTQVK
jgi:hypothetical protein